MNSNFKALLETHTFSSHPLDDTLPGLYLCPLSDNAVTTLEGEQSRDYLQGQLTCDVLQLTEACFLRSAHCDAKGKSWAVLNVFTIGQKYFLSAQRDELAASTAQLQKYGVFSKTTIADESDNYFTFGLGGEAAASWLENQWQVTFGDNRSAADVPDGKVLKLSDTRFLLITNNAPALLALFEDKLYRQTLWAYCNIQAGLPHLTAASTGQYVPQMLNLHALDAISFDKGCYTGQEMVARMKYLGKNKRATYILTGKAATMPEDGHELQLSLGDSWRRSGQVLNFAGTPDNLHILAVLPNDLTSDALLRLKDDEYSALTIQPLPYSLNAD